ncbi:hypothetical protein FQY83_17510 [Luteimonas marina]|uniref:Uncharacterized protein n=1 Tax=Luteimonas marina TaxID=488485 RepID=A0A5C5TTN0_9GAMM|nr:hypothetical protein [Luteimonas marina]TWT17017.1 hypothetical protein FQY83_17510 [Luteimonas marina]
MAISSFRREVLKAFSFPVVLFVALPFIVTMFSAPLSFSNVVHALLILLALLVPLYLTGFMLAPWAGRRLPATKAPAFLMSTAAALASAVSLSVLVALSGSPSLSFSTAVIFAFFALPASVLGALLFIGGCARLQASTPPEHGKV